MWWYDIFTQVNVESPGPLDVQRGTNDLQFCFLMNPETLYLLWHTVCYFCTLFSSIPHLNKTMQVDCMYKCGEASLKKKKAKYQVASMHLASNQ